MIKPGKTVIIADDHPIFRMGLSSMISAIDGYEVVAEAENGEDTIRLIDINLPDYAVIDIDMPRATGIDVANHILHKGIKTKIIILTAHTDPITIEQALNLNYVSILFKESASRELRLCIDSMENGKIFISPICRKFMENRSGESAKTKKILDELNTLSPSEIKILHLISQNFTTNQIAEKLSNSYKTIENHRSNISLKLGLKGSQNLLRFAIDNQKLIDHITRSKFH